MADPVRVMSIFADLGLRADAFLSGLGQSKIEFSAFENAIAGLPGLAVTAFAGAATAVGAFTIGVGLAAGDFANEYDIALRSISARTGAIGEDLEDLGDIAQDVFVSGLGDNIDDVSDALVLVRNQIRGLNDEDLRNVTSGVLQLRDTFDIDMRESVDAVDQLMDQLGLTSTQALDFVAEGLQRGLNNNNDFIDSIREYSNQFSAAGFTAEQFFSILETGNAGGVLGTDKVADSIKELQVRFDAGDKTIKEGFASMGLSWDSLSQQVQSGAINIADIFPLIVQRLGEMEASGENYKAAMFNIFGTQAEDLQGLILQLDAGRTSLMDMSGASGDMAIQFQSLPELWQQIGREFQISLLPLGQQLLDAANSAMPQVREAFGVFQTEILPLLQNVFGWLIGTALPWVLDFGSQAMVMFSEFSAEFGAAWNDAQTSISEAINKISEAFGLSTSDISLMDVALGTLQFTLDAVVLGMEIVAEVVDKVNAGIDALSPAVDAATFAWEKFNTAASSVEGAFPDWMIPRSPPPMAEGLAMIKKNLEDVGTELNRLPTSDAMSMSGGGGMVVNNNNQQDNRQVVLNNNGGSSGGPSLRDVSTLLSLA